MPQIKALIATLVLIMGFSGCASSQIHNEVLQGVSPQLQPAGPYFGKISLRPETRWRADQKEPSVRERIALAAMDQVFRDAPFGQVAETRAFSVWSSESEQHLDEARSAGIDTVLVVTVEELGPLFYVSVPILWSSYSDIKFEIKAIKVLTGETILNLKHHRVVGGPFQLRGLWPLQSEMEIALRDALGLSK